MYDIVGDIHGRADRLVPLLQKLGYQYTTQGWQHCSRKVIFVGDLIDRGSFELETLKLVKEMIDNNNAYAVIGNHEFNAIGWFTPDKKDPETFLRPHNERNRKQHRVFLQAVDENSECHQSWIDWFKTLPLFLDFGSIRVVHACWDNAAIASIKPYLDERHCLIESYRQQAYHKNEILCVDCETLLKGKEIALPEGFSYFDKEGTRRTRSRIKWWALSADTLNELCMLPDDKPIKGMDCPIDFNGGFYQDDIPVFFGHYWLSGQPHILTTKLACVDYSAAIESGKLVAYRWDGESELTNRHFVF